MTEILLYRAHGPVTVDPAPGDGLTVTGLAAPYNEITVVDDGDGPYHECFDPGAFTHIVERWPARRLKVQLEHPDRFGRGTWVGRGQAWRDGPEGLRVELRLDDTPDGHAAAFKIRDGQTPGMSIEFVPGAVERRWHPELGAEVTHRRNVRAIGHVALVPQGAYRGALVEAVRAAGPWTVDRIRSTVDGPDVEPVEVPVPSTPHRDALSEWLSGYHPD